MLLAHACIYNTANTVEQHYQITHTCEMATLPIVSHARTHAHDISVLHNYTSLTRAKCNHRRQTACTQTHIKCSRIGKLYHHCNATETKLCITSVFYCVTTHFAFIIHMPCQFKEYQWGRVISCDSTICISVNTIKQKHVIAVLALNNVSHPIKK